MIWFALLIPFIFAVATWIVFHHKVIWWEVALNFVVSIVLVLIAYQVAVLARTTDTEYWTGWVTKTEYDEGWTEEYTVQVEYEDSKGKTHTRTEKRRRYHPPVWTAYDSTGESYSITSERYRELVQRFGNEKKENLWRTRQVSVGDGDRFYSVYLNDRSKMVVSTVSHYYENRVQASDAIYHFDKVEDVTGLHDYPSLGDHQHVPSILGANTNHPANVELCKRNAELGGRKQVRVWVLLFPNLPLDKGLAQEQYWKGGNKNELVICIGTNGDEVKWCHVFSWCQDERLKIDLRNFVREQKELKLMEVVSYTTNEVEKRWKRREFADFKYIAVRPSGTSTIITLILTILANAGVSAFAILNDITPDNGNLRQIFAKRFRHA